MFAIPIDTTAAQQELEMQLDGDEFILRTIWNERDARFYLDVFDVKREPIWTSQAIVVGMPLLRQCVHPGRPKGEIVAQDTTNQGLEASLSIDEFGNVTHDLGARVQLVYLTADDVATIPGAA